MSQASVEEMTGIAPPAEAGQPSAARPLRVLQLDPRVYERSLSCVHCGMCLPACPTYTTTGHEGDSPRGRIQLIKGLAEGTVAPTDAVKRHLDLCLDCRGCETACPSGVVYHELIEDARARMSASEKLTAQGRFMRWVFFNVFVHPTRLKLALFPARLMQKIGLYGLLRKSGAFRVLPGQLRKMEEMLPERGRLWPTPLPARVQAKGAMKKRAAFFAGCIGAVMFDEVNRKAIDLLAACGADVVTPAGQGCCGAIHHHNGAHHPAEEMAKRNIDEFLRADVDYVVTDVAGCGAMLREYDFLLRDDPAYAAKAKAFAAKVRDVAEVLAELGLPEMKYPVTQTVTYHDACHLAHAQKVTAAPRELLAKVPGIKLVPLAESDMCCGAAGTYNLTQPEMAAQLGGRKVANIAATGASLCATGNVGCQMQIQSQAGARGVKVRVVHPVEILHRAVFGE